MKRRYAVFAVVLAVSILIGLQVVETKNNPLVTKAAYPYTSAINISEPKNTTYFSEENLTLEVNFTAWVNYDINYFVTYILDGENNSIIIPSDYIVPANHSWDPFVGIIKGSVALPKLSEGIHNITILAQAHIDTATTNSSSLVTFTVNAPSSPTPYPTSSQSMPTINTGPTLSVELNPSVVYILVFLIVIVTVASISLIYFKKRCQKLGGKV
jgi:hypothetical protein